LELDRFIQDPESYQNGTVFALIADRSQWESDLKSNFKNTSKFKIMDDDYLWLTSAWNVYPFSFLYESMNNFILGMHQHGHIIHFERLKAPSKVQIDDPEPEVLTMFMLSAGFIVWLTTISFGFVAFVCEHIWRYFTVTRYLVPRSNVYYDELEMRPSSSERQQLEENQLNCNVNFIEVKEKCSTLNCETKSPQVPQKK